MPVSPVVDLQINGCFGVDFNADQLTGEALQAACRRLRNEGTAGVLATVITADVQMMIERVRRLVALRRGNRLIEEMIWGLHVEGPFLSDRPGFAGAHAGQALCDADCAVMESILEAAEGLVRMVTLAPERDDGCRVIRMLASQGIVVAAGHSDASLDQLKAAIDAGLSMFTHLGNGCPRQLDRHDNIIQRVLSLADRMACSVIADGRHLPYFVLKNLIRGMGISRVAIVSDAMAGAGMGAGRFSLGNCVVDVTATGETGLADRPGYLAGSAITLAAVVPRLRQELQLSDGEIEQLTSINPRRMLMESAQSST